MRRLRKTFNVRWFERKVRTKPAIKSNTKEVTIPWSVVGQDDFDIREAVQAVQNAIKANK